MREHEVPTHLQAEDKVLLWFTFPQLVAITAVAALAYGAYRYIPVGSSEVRIALAVLLGLAGMAMIVGKVGGRRLPMVAADLLRYRLGARRYAGPLAELVRPEAPAPVQAAPSPLALMAKNARRIMHRRNGRMSFRPHAWFGKGRRRRRKGKDPKQDKKKTKRSKDWRNLLAVLAVAATAAAGAVAPAVQADGHHPEGIGFEITEPVPGRRIYVESLQVSGDSAEVTLRAAAAIDLQVRAYGGPEGRISVFRGTARLRGGEERTYTFPLSGDSPSLTLSWRDGLGQAGALSLKEYQVPYPLPFVEGELCNLRLASLAWTPGYVDGVIESRCEDSVEELVRPYDGVRARDRDGDGLDGRGGHSRNGERDSGRRRGPDNGRPRSQRKHALPDQCARWQGRPRGHPTSCPGSRPADRSPSPCDADTPPREERADNQEGQPVPPRHQQDRLQDGGVLQSGWDHHPARHIGHPVHPRQHRGPGRDRHRKTP